MISENLKQSILQAAIQGKITEQRLFEENATDLLNEIQRRKSELIFSGKIKKEKVNQIITESEIPFDIPENWKWCRMGDYCLKLTDFVASGSFKSLRENVPSLKNENFSILVKTADFSNNFTKDLTYTTREGYEFLHNSNLFGGELILPNIGSIGKSFIVPYLDKPMTLAPNSIMVVFTNPELLIPYFSYYIKTNTAIEQLIGLSSGTAIPKFSKTQLKTLLIPVPPIEEQKRIVEKLEKILNEVDKLKEDEMKLHSLQKSFPKKIRDSLIQYAIQGKLTQQLHEDGNAKDLLIEVLSEKTERIKNGIIKKEKPLLEISEDEKPFDLPINWCWVRLGEISDYGTSRQINPKKIKSNSWILELEDIQKETFKLISKHRDRKPGSNKNHFKAGDILYGKLRPYLKKVIIADEPGFCSTEIIPFTCFGKINPEYIKFCLVSPELDSFINGITHGMDMPRLGTEKAKNLLIPLPPLREQDRIVKCLNSILPLCTFIND